MIDLLALVVSHLRSKDINVYGGQLPQGAKRPAGLIALTGALLPSSHEPAWLGEYDAQMDAWGKTRQEAHTFLSNVVAELRTNPTNDHGVVSRFEVVSVIDDPDPDWPDANGRPGPRFIAQLRFHAHPAA